MHHPFPHAPSNPARRVAVIGSGISGLSAAWLMSKEADVTLYEADTRIGGHSNTAQVETDAGRIPVDTGFIVYNELNYPNLVAMFGHLGVGTMASDMSFAASLDRGGFEYSGAGLSGLVAQKANIMRPRFWRMMSDLVRFYRKAPAMAKTPEAATMTLGEFLKANKFSEPFIRDHLLPMGAAIWSVTPDEMRDYPLLAFLRFFESHGLLSLGERPVWRTVAGGSQSYVEKLVEGFRGTIRTGTPVKSVRRLPGGVSVTDASGATDIFTDVVIASHGDQALAMLADADAEDRTLLGAFTYSKNEAVLHSDARLMPRRKSVWASWNYLDDGSTAANRNLCVTYWMNRLQNLPCKDDIFVTLNPVGPVDETKVFGRYTYEHPLFNAAAIAAQRDIWSIQGKGGVWYCGAHLGSGFHEDGLQSGLAVAEAVTGVRRPWQVQNESGRIFLRKAVEAAE